MKNETSLSKLTLKNPSLGKYHLMSIINKGTGAGGSKTNENGLPYEEMTDLKTEYIKNTDGTVCFDGSSKKFQSLSKGQLFRQIPPKPDIQHAHGCKQPDECYVIENPRKIMFILEKKFQQCGGSVCEKIQTASFKKWQYQRLYPDYKIVYIYCLSDWFRQHCQAELRYLREIKVPVFFGNDPDYKQQIISFMLSFD